MGSASVRARARGALRVRSRVGWQAGLGEEEGWTGGNCARWHPPDGVTHSSLGAAALLTRQVFVTSEYICIAMEYASGGSLFTYVQRAVRLKEAAARWFFQQLIIGLDYCHRRGVVNRYAALHL